MPNALLSVWDKVGITEFAKVLMAKGWTLIASGGTWQHLSGAGLPVRSVSQVTGEPEILGGRVKTLHPSIHAALLARDLPEDHQTLSQRGWDPIDLVAVNLYPFEDVIAQPGTTIETALENIDIGGVAILRAAAKNFYRVTVLSDPQDYQEALDPPDPQAFRLRMAYKAFTRTANYEAAIEAYLAQQMGISKPFQTQHFPAFQLRYGENPHQEATFYRPQPDNRPLGGELLNGKPLSYNNILDLDAAWCAVQRFETPAIVIVKHTSPCGIATANKLARAVAPAIASDPVSAFGSVIACNRKVTSAFLNPLGELFVECIVAPTFTPAARRKLAVSLNLRLLQMQDPSPGESIEFRSVTGGLLSQTVDYGDPPDAHDWRVVTKRAPTHQEISDLRFAWLACAPVKSNAIVLARSDDVASYTIGIGSGQPNRVDSVKIAGDRAGDLSFGSVMASDAFFPFADGIKLAAQLGITAVVQPGGSRGDAQVIEAADEAGMAMVFTGVRHFRH